MAQVLFEITDVVRILVYAICKPGNDISVSSGDHDGDAFMVDRSDEHVLRAPNGG